MSQLSLNETRISEGYAVRRSDGQEFSLIWNSNGKAVLYTGAPLEPRPMLGLAEFDITVADKLDRARQWMLAYPDEPAR